MTTSTQSHVEEFLEIAGIRTQLRRGGQGDPLLILHSELWIPGWTKALQELGKHYNVFVPSLPGFGLSERADWIMTIDDVAVWVSAFVEEQKLSKPVRVVGFSMGAWIATHIAAVNRDIFSKMVLVNPVGVQPTQGQIWDYYRWSAKEAFEQAFSDPTCEEYQEYYGTDWTPEETEQVEVNRDMGVRLTWKPYMWSYTTNERAKRITTPTLIIVGQDNKVVPTSCGEVLHNTIRDSRMEAIAGGGHVVEMERPTEFTHLAIDFLAGK